MNELQIINIDGVDCYEKDGTAYLKLDTVARGLGFTEVKNGKEYVMWRRVDGYLKELRFGTSAERPEYIPENVFYRLAMKAKNETAERFQAKVADEIIPSIRKTGGYQSKVPQGKELLALAVLEAQKTIEEQNAQIERMRPKEIFADAVATSKQSILIGQLAKLICQNGHSIGQNRLFQWMRDNGYLMKSGNNYNMPMQRYVEQGLFEIKERSITNPDGSVKLTRTTKVTGKGQQYFINKFLKKTS